MRRCHGDPRDHQWFDEQLYAMLAGLCGTDVGAMSILTNSENQNGIRGAISWHKIMSECRGRGRARKEELRELVVTDVPVATGYADTMQVIETWEKNTREYELLTNKKLTDEEKCQTLKDIIPADLRRDVNATEKESYEEVYSYVSKQVNLHQ